MKVSKFREIAKKLKTKSSVIYFLVMSAAGKYSSG
mgnify:CR=1 FL=1